MAQGGGGLPGERCPKHHHRLPICGCFASADGVRGLRLTVSPYPSRLVSQSGICAWEGTTCQHVIFSACKDIKVHYKLYYWDEKPLTETQIVHVACPRMKDISSFKGLKRNPLHVPVNVHCVGAVVGAIVQQHQGRRRDTPRVHAKATAHTFTVLLIAVD
eukprot:jgi/Chlat1/2013/Chrsp158S02320